MQEIVFSYYIFLLLLQTNASCPQDRKAFSKVLVRVRLGAEDVEREVVVQKEESEVVLLPEVDNPTYCEVYNARVMCPPPVTMLGEKVK